MDGNEELNRGPAEGETVIDIHPPHESAHSWRDILIHLATITVGLFIALSLEGCVEWQHHRHLVHEARANIRSEMEDNQKELKDAWDTIHKEQAQVKADIAALKILKQNPEAHNLSVNLRFNTSAVANASWNTARETGALSFMSYPEVKKYAEVYDAQKLFSDQTMRVLDTYTSSFSVLYIFDIDDKAAEAVKKDDAAIAIQKVLAVQSELMLYESIATSLDREYSETLQRRF
jgi:hypothetical protein